MWRRRSGMAQRTDFFPRYLAWCPTWYLREDALKTACTALVNDHHRLLWSKNSTRLDSRGYDPAIARPAVCVLPTPSRILNAK